MAISIYSLYNYVVSNRKISFTEGEYYHIYNRGNSKQKIFLDKSDYVYFMKLLYCSNTYKNFTFREDITKKNIDAFDFDRGQALVDIGAWVLMPNHFHIYLTISHKSDLWLKKDKNAVSEFMRKISTAYAKYFNTKYSRTGGLFEGKFKATHITKDNQARYLFSYIHLNPIKLIDSTWKEDGIKDIKKALAFLETYKWNSYVDFINPNIRKEFKILELKSFPKYFLNLKDFNKEILTWLEYKEI